MLVPEAPAGEIVAQSQLIFVLNWYQELLERVPRP